MARRRKGRPIHGWLNFNKPLGMGSTQAVGLVRRLFDAQKVGHGGTLDPLASGVLPIAFGEATKTVAYVMDAEKTYRFTIAWGAETDSCDREGTVTERADARPSKAEITAVLPAFVGTIDQAPPAFSAIRIDGVRAYELARAGAAPAMSTRKVTVHNLRLLEAPDADHARFEVTCGKGTYIRSLARDIARALGTVGHVAALERTRVGRFNLADAVSRETLERASADGRDISLAKSGELGHIPAARGPGDTSGPDALLAFLLPIETALDDIPALALTGGEAALLRNGQPVPIRRPAKAVCDDGPDEGAIMLATADGGAVALVRFENGQVHPVRVFNL